MDKNKIKRDAEFYKDLIVHLQNLRPICHTISAITTVIFICIFLGQNEVIAALIQGNEIAFYITLSLIAIYPIWWLEQKRLNPLIDAFGKALSKAHSNRLIAALFVIMVPFIILTGMTSFVGSSEGAHQRADYLHGKQLSGLIESLKTNSNESHSTRENEKREDRRNGRDRIVEKYNRQLAKVHQTNLIKYPNKSLEYISRKDFKDSTLIEGKMDRELKNYDFATDTIINNLIASHNDLKQSEQISKVSLIEAGQHIANEAAKRLKKYGAWIGWFAVLCVIISILAAIVKNWLEEILEIKTPQKKKQKKSNMKIPFVSQRASTKTGGNSSSRVSKIKGKLNQLGPEVIKENVSAMIEATELMNELESFGIEASFNKNGRPIYVEDN